MARFHTILSGQVDEFRRDVRADIASLRDDVSRLDRKIDDETDFVAGKIDHYIGAFHDELARDRTRFEEERYVRRVAQRKIEKRLDEVESRLERLEAASFGRS